MSTTVWSILAVCLVAFVRHTTPAASTPCTSEQCHTLDNQLNQLKAHLQKSLEHQWKFIQEQQKQLTTLKQTVVEQLVAFVRQATPATFTPCTSENSTILDNQLNQLQAQLQEKEKQLATLIQTVAEQQKQLEKQEHTLAEQEDGM